jgi:hypothetical protein
LFKSSTGIVKNLFKDSQLIDFIKIIIKELNPAILEANPIFLISIYLPGLRPQTAQGDK